MNAVEFKSVTKAYPNYSILTQGVKNLVVRSLSGKPNSVRSFEAFRDVTFTIRRGETVGVIGRNGAGKSTMLGLIARVLKPTEGQVLVHGRVSPLLELGGGFHPELSGRENVLLNSVLLGMSRAEAHEKMEEIIEYSELQAFANQPVRTYSSGMQARLGFSVAAHLNPDILLIDEVLAVGDIRFQKKCLETLESFREKGVTIILVSHSHGDILRICKRSLWIDQHRLRADGASDEVIPQYLTAMG